MDIFNKDDLRLKYNIGPTANDYKNPTKIRERERELEQQRRKREEEERRRIAEENRRQESLQTNIKSVQELSKANRDLMTSNTPTKQYQSSMLRNIGFSTDRDERKKPYLDFSNNLENDLNTRIATQKALGVKDKDIEQGLVPQEDNTIQERLEKLSTQLRPGKEGFIYGLKEGYYEREIQDMLSRENVRKINGLPNEVDTIEKFIEDHPELQREERNTKIEEWLAEGIRGDGSQIKQRVDSYTHALKQPSTYAWAGAITAASIMAAPFTGGASLAAGGALLATSPLVAGTATSKAIAMLGPIAGMRFGMKTGAYDNMAKLEARSSYVDLVEAGVDKRIAGPLSETVGAVNGLLEFMQLETAFGAIPGVSDLVGNAKKMALKEFTKKAIKVVGNYGVDLASEVFEEMAQAGVSEMGLELGKYLQDAPDPSTIEGLKVLGKTMTSEDFRDTILNEGYHALQSMWLTPILSEAGRTGVNQTMQGMYNATERMQVAGISEQENKVARENNKKTMDYILNENGATDQAIKFVNETLDPQAMAFLASEKTILEDMLQREDITNQDKEKMGATLEKISTVLSKVMYDEKVENPDIEYRATNRSDVEAEILSDGWLDQATPYNEILNYNIELYKQSKDYGVADTIKEGLKKGTNKAEIIRAIEKRVPKKERKPVNLMSMINSVEVVSNEIEMQIINNTLGNILEVQANNVENIKTESIIQDIQDETETVEQDDNIDTPQSTTTVDSEVVQGINQPSRENLAQENVVAENAIQEKTIDKEVKEEEKVDSKPISTEKYQSADIKKIPLAMIHIDKETYQFRYDTGNEYGATRKYDGVPFNENLADPVLLREDEYNDLWMVNGHHRYNKAMQSGVEFIDAKIISYKDYTVEEARSLGAMINIAQDNATSIDVAKLIRDTGTTDEEFTNMGVRPNSKIKKDGLALANLNDWIFTQVATKGIPIERAIIIGRELGDNPDGQDQIIKAIDNIEVKGKSITNDVLTELIAEVKGTAREEFTEMTLFGEETFTKNFSLERAELVSYVKNQLKGRVSLLKNVSKNKNAAILQELGNTIAVDDNVKEMNTADQALFILDKTLNYQGTKVNELFNSLAREYADADNKASVKKKALNELISLMESGNVFDLINQQVKKADIQDNIMGGQTNLGLSEQELEQQEELIGQETMMQLKNLEETRIIADDDTKKGAAFRATGKIVEAIKNNPIFNGLTINYSNESGKVANMSKEELISYGYGHLEEAGEKTIYGFYNDGNRTITLNSEATRDTILEEAIHDIQYRLQEIDPSLAVLVSEWESEVREQALKEGITIPDGYELLAQALVYTEYGYASTNPFIANLIAVDDEIVDRFTTLLGSDIAERGFGFVESDVAKEDRQLRGKYEEYTDRIFKSKYVGQTMEAKQARAAEIVQDLENARASQYYQPYTNQYVIVGPSTKDGKYQITYFHPEFGPVSDSQHETTQEVADRLIEDGYFYKTDEIHYQLKNYDRSMADELYERLHLQRGPGTDIDTTSDRGNVSVPINGTDIVRIREAILTGNFTEADYEQLIKNNTNLVNYDKQVLLKDIKDAEKKGLNRPNKEVTFKQFINRFYNYDIESDNDMSEYDVKKLFLYNIDSTIEKKGYLEEAKKISNYDFLSKQIANAKSIDDIIKRLKDQHKYFQDKTETYRHRGLQYQLKEGVLNEEDSTLWRFPKHRGELTLEKIERYLKDVGGGSSFNKEVSKFESPEQLQKKLFWHGSANYISRRLIPGFRLSEDRRGGGYGEIQHTISLSKSKKVASNFSGSSDYINLYPVVVLEGAKIINRPDISDAIELEDELLDLWKDKVDAVTIGDWESDSSEQELVVLNPRILSSVGKSETHRVYKLKIEEPTIDEITAMWENSKQVIADQQAKRNSPEYKAKQKELNERIDALLGRNARELNLQLKAATDTPEFKNWFKDSKVVDGSGDPLVVYHGTEEVFTMFDYKHIGSSSGNEGYYGKGFYFTPNLSLAEEYGENVVKSYLSLQKPLNIELSDITYDTLDDFIPGLNKDTHYGPYGFLIYNIMGNADLFRQNLLERGYDGVIYSEKGVITEYVAFHPTQIKSIYNNGMFNEYDPNINYQLKATEPVKPIVNVDGFYSNLENVINDKMGKRAKASDLMNMLTKNGVKPEEMEWFEIASFLEGKDFVYKNELLDHMREKSIEFTKEDMGDEFASYTLDGGDNYRFNAYVYNNPGHPFMNNAHFGDLKNVIAHTRYKDRKGSNGEKILLIEELQSDWHQKGRQEGYSKNLTELEKQELTKLNNRLDVIADSYSNKYGSDWIFKISKDEETVLTDLQTEINSLAGIQTNIPDAPLKESITDFLFKTAIKDAVEGGYDYIAWTTGTQQADRYNMRKFADNISWLTQEGKDKGTLLAMKGDTEIFEKEMYPSEIADHVGKQLAQELLSKPIEMDIMNIVGTQSVDGDDLSIGGEFHKKLYDNYIPRSLRKYGKKWGLDLDVIGLTYEKLINEVGTDNYWAERDILIQDSSHENLIERAINANVRQGLINEYMQYWSENPGSIVTKAAKNRLITDLLMNEYETLAHYQPSIPVTPEMIEDVMTQGQPLFQLKEEPQTNGNLLAIHNLSEEQLKNTIKLGGFPFPSIAVVNKEYEHSRYGDISVLFGKNTINPRLNPKNKLYGGDAWTPTFPTISRKISKKAADALYEKINNIVPADIRREYMLSLDEDNLDDQINRAGNFVDAYKYNSAMKYAYLKEQGIDIEMPTKEKQYSHEADLLDILKDKYPVFSNEKYIDFNEAEKITNDVISDLNSFYGVDLYNANIFGFSQMSRLGEEVYEFSKRGRETVIDYYELASILDKQINQEGFEKWLNDISSGIIEKEGIRNNADYFTPSGNRRKWESLHIEVTLDNIVKIMSGKAQKGSDTMFPSFPTFAATVTDNFRSIEEMRQSSDRLVSLDTDSYSEISKQYSEKYMEIIGEMAIPSERNQFMAMDAIGEAIIESVSKSLTKQGIKKVLDSYYGLKYEDSTVDKIIELVKLVRTMPTEYFEAKPQRAVYLNEIAAVIVPDTLSPEVEQMLKDNGIHLIEKYSKEDDTARQRAMDNILRQNDVSFQLKETDTTTPAFKNWFKDSKVVDEEGNPLKVYHGTEDAGFSEFVSFLSNYYFTSSEETASTYANGEYDLIKPNGVISEGIYPVYLSMQNPYVIEGYGSNWDDINGKDINDWVDEIKSTNEYDGAIFKDVIDNHPNWDTDNLSNIYVVFNPNQIKSVYNQGTWDINDANIYYQMKEGPDIEERSWGQTVRDAAITDPELKQILTDNRFMYEVKHNEETMINAAKLIDEKGLNWVEAHLLSDLDIKDPTLGAASQILIFKFMQEGETDRAFKMIDAIAPKLTTMGQAIQIFSVFGRQTPEGMLRYAHKTLRGAMTEQEIINTNKDTELLVNEFNQVNKEALEEIDLVGELVEIQSKTPEELLARRIASTLATPKTREKDALQMMIDTLFKVAKESPLPDNKPIPTDPLIFVVDAIVNREEYTNVWEIAKEIVANEFKDDPDKLTMLEDYFNKGINKTFADSQLSKAMDNELKDMSIKIKDIVREHFSTTDKVTESLVDKLVSRSGLTKEEALILEHHIRRQMDINTRAAKESILKNTFKKRKSYERKTLDRRIIELSNLGALQNADYKHLVAEKLGLPTMTPELGQYIYEQANYIQTLKPGRQRDIEVGKMIKEIMDHVPTSKWSKVATFRIISMLLTGKTTMRNLLGNNMFKDLEFFTLNTIGATLDKAISIGTGNRTALFRLIDAHKVYGKGYMKGLKIGIEDALMGIDTSDSSTQFDLKQNRTFKFTHSNRGGIIGAAENVVKNILPASETALDIALRATDRAASLGIVMDSLAEQMEIAGVTEATDEMMAIAIALAKYRTFQDETALSNMFSSIKKGANYIGVGGKKIEGSNKRTPNEFGVGDLIMPFPKTPANILGRAIDYSPVGAALTVYKLLSDTSGSSYLKQRMAVEGFSRAIMGTGIIAIGAVLAKMGILTGSNPDDDEDIYKLQKAHGLRDFSVNVSAIYRHLLGKENAGELKKGDTIASYDWAEPIAMALAIGADTQLGGTTSKDLLSVVIRAWEAGVTTLTNQPLLTGLSNLFRPGDLSEGVSQLFLDMPASFTPTLFSHVAQFIDGRDTDPYTFYEGGRAVASKVMNKVPGLRANIPTRHTMLGEEKRYYPEDQNLITRALNIFLNPSITSKYMPPEEAELLFDLYESSGDPDIVPRGPQKSYTIDKVKYTFTPETWEEMSKWLGNRYKQEIGRAMNTYMRGWSAEEQADEIKYIIKQVKNEAKEKALELGTKIE